MLGFLDRMIAAAEQLGPADVRPLAEAGLDRRAISEALYVAYLFNIYNRCADAFGFDMQTQEQFDADAKFLLRFGYR